MGISSSLILKGTRVPRLAEICAAAADAGSRIAFPAGIELDAWDGAWMPVTLDGAETGFEFGLAKTAGDKGLPRAVRKAGKTILYFEARGETSAQATDAVREAIASLVPASTWFESLGVLVDPDGTEQEIDGEPEDEQAYVPPPPPPPPHPALRPLLWAAEHGLAIGLVIGVIYFAIGVWGAK